jgi:hypothetical protein
MEKKNRGQYKTNSIMTLSGLFFSLIEMKIKQMISFFLLLLSRSSMTQWPIQSNVYTLIPQNNSMNKSNSQETTHILTIHNTNTPRISPTINHPISSPQQSTFDDSLTNLSWLHDINILKRTMPPINSSSNTNNKRKESSSPCSSSSNHTIYPNDISDNNDDDDDDDHQWKMYKTNPQAKPVYSYSQLILLALKQSGYEKMTLQMIYEWVAEHFPYFKKMEPTWQVGNFLLGRKRFVCFFSRIQFDIIYL